MKKKTKTIQVNYLARVEGEGALIIKAHGNEVREVKLKIFEPPRFFEAFLRGRSFMEVPDITSRICGICPVAYQMSAIHAIEDAFKITIPEYLEQLRRVFYCGEWIESHMLHVHMLHAPDFLGYDDVIQMAKKYPKIVEDGLQIKKCGNSIVKLFGGREIHPINAKVGGFYSLPPKSEVDQLLSHLKWARDATINAVKWTTSLEFPDLEREYEFVALTHQKEYPMNRGRIISNNDLNIAVDEYDANFEEIHVPYSTALHCEMKGRGEYFVGPMARYNLNFEHLSPLVKEVATLYRVPRFCKNPFMSIVIRTLESLYAFDEAIRILEDYHSMAKLQPFVDIKLDKNETYTGYSCTEAPRGSLYHRYKIKGTGEIEDAKIVPPTSQNQKTIESDLRDVVKKWLSLPEKELTLRCEQAIRNYDPCISCSTHFLKLEIQSE